MTTVDRMRTLEREVRAADVPLRDGDDRYAIAVLRGGQHRRIAETSLEGIGITIVTLRSENEIHEDDSLGIYDRETRTWIVNPWAKGQ